MKANSHPDFPVIDAHVHLYPDAIAQKVTPSLASRFGNPPSFDGTVEGCRAKDAASGISASVNLPVATKPDSVQHTNDFWARSNAAERGKSPAVFSLACLHPQVADKGAEVERIAAAGFAGVKFHPEYQLFRFNDATMDDAWAAMAEFGLVAYLHAGGERVFRPPFHSTPTEIAELQRRFPRLKVAAAHLGGFGMWDESEATLVGSQVYLDLSHTFCWMPDEHPVAGPGRGAGGVPEASAFRRRARAHLLRERPGAHGPQCHVRTSDAERRGELATSNSSGGIPHAMHITIASFLGMPRSLWAFTSVSGETLQCIRQCATPCQCRA